MIRSLSVHAGLLIAAGAFWAADASAMSREQILENMRRQAATQSASNGSAAAGDTRSIGVRRGDGSTVSGQATTASVAPGAQPRRTTAAEPVSLRRDEPPVVPAEQRIDLRVTFETNSAFIRPDAEGVLSELCAALREAPAGWSFNIIGHADASGSPEHNRNLSDARAREVARHLTRQCGIAADRLVTYGLGSSRLLPGVPAVSEENRRVEVSVNSI